MALVSKNFADIITFTRADATTCATRVNQLGLIEVVAANVARFDFDPTTLVCKGLLIEESRTNLLLQSQTFNTTWAVPQLTVTADATTSPAGDTTMDRLVENTATNPHSLYQDVTITAGATTVLTVYAKEDVTSTKRYLTMSFTIATLATNDYAVVRYDLATGLVTLAGNGPASVDFPNDPAELVGDSAVYIGNGIYRCSLTVTSANTTVLRARIGMTSSATLVTGSASGFYTYTGDGTSGLYVWGAQLEQAAFPTSYIPTTTAVITRAADVASITGTNFTDFYNAAEGTLFGQGTVDSLQLTNRYIATIGKVTNTNFDMDVGISRSADSRRVAFINDSTNQFAYSPAGTALSTKIALGYKLNDSIAAIDGTTGTLDTSCSIPSAMVTLWIGSAETGVAPLNGHVQRITYFPARLTDAELAALTV